MLPFHLYIINLKTGMEEILMLTGESRTYSDISYIGEAVKIAKKQGLKEVCGIAGYVVPVYLPSNMFREFFGVVKDTIKGNM